ncbi:RnfABCDGE type electron transport complex subunit G [Acetobacteroides hydrogenigenes]|uniref:Ion-translocating oxidoreductase complex subunit G n=1 Tax=Acetobacteroides hydrogenigenes TaxID=979970 RepID=A0A4R2EFM4_9BACT|nr:RnfABCDGE type electron transport complex subunit G [Acetobacteroides hydrogenigenes]TCN67718.1 electron transport complex protein RnfG [Acetobacteroides hydrogenigenes]
MAKESSFKNMVLTLLVISFFAAAALAGVYLVTLAPIGAAKAAKINEAIQKVVPTFDNNPGEEVYKMAVDGDTLRLYPARKGGKLVGTAIETFTNKGFAGHFTLMVGLMPDGTIKSVEVLAHKETPGLGDKMEKSKSNFSVQFEGKNPKTFKMMVKKDGGDVDAITASTITSRAFTDAVNRAYEAYMKGGKQ